MLNIKIAILALFIAFAIVDTRAEDDYYYKKPFKLSCVSDPNQNEFKFVWLQEGFEKTIQSHDLDNEFGNKSSFLFHFVGYGDTIRMDKPRGTFYLGRGIVQESEPGQTVCYADYANGNGEHITKEIEYHNSIRNRIPYVAGTLTTFIAKLKEFNYIKSPEQITVTGFSLGGHLAGMLGRNLNALFKKPIQMVLAFDPPNLGFEKGNPMFTQRVQKGDARYVEITRSSTMGIETYDGDTNVILNDLRQPQCQCINNDVFCNHLAALLLHGCIFNQTKPAPFYASPDRESAENGNILIGFWNTNYTGKGVVYLKTVNDFQ